MDNPPVIVGVACRVPGASSPSQLWDNIVQQKDLRREMPKERFNIDAFYHPDRLNKGTTNTKYGYFLDQPLGHFDAEFFGVSGKEAAAMDPQQRLLLEVVYEALEDAGITLDTIRGSDTSVYCGTFANANDYNSLQAKDLEHYPIYALTGTGNPIVSNRISYFYDLRGPSMTIDTACSSSLVGFHLGSRSLTSGESSIAIIAGTAINFAPNIFQTISDMGFLSDDGRCRTFDVSGGGYVRGDGVCAVILKLQGDALANGDRIRAVVRGTAINHDGKTEGITLPSAEAHAALFRTAYRTAGIDPAHTQYFEAHGTGTKAGDPREAKAIGEVFGTESRREPIWVGSIKPNIGHLEGAAGLSGLIKTTLALEKGIIPPNMLFHDPNPDILFDEWKIRVPTSEVEWSTPAGIPRRASINSSGYGGANAHVILEGYDGGSQPNGIHTLWPAEDRSYLIPITSHSQDAGSRALDAIIGYVTATQKLKVASLAHTLGTKRSLHGWRSFAVGHDRETLLRDLATARDSSRWVNATEPVSRIGFVFTGQGALSFDTGRDLTKQSPLFAGILDKCDTILQSLPDGPAWSIRGELLRDKKASRLGESRFSQPICTAIQLALVCLLREWGITAAATCGHSSGEIAAAYAAGILSIEAAIIVAYYRGLHMSQGKETGLPGAMMAVGLGKKEAAKEVSAFEGRLSVAAINGPTSVTISGNRNAILELKKSLDARHVFARLLKVEQAFHSHHMVPLAPGYQRALEDSPHFGVTDATCRMFSSVTARMCNGGDLSASYWAQNMVSPVRFSDALTGIVLHDDDDQQNVDVLLEIGPHPALKGPSLETLSSLSLNIPYLATLSRSQSAQDSLLECAGQLFSLGYPVNLASVNTNQTIVAGSVVHRPQVARLYDLPSYSWNHKDYWFMTRLVSEHVHRPWKHALLGAPVPGSTKSMPRFRNYIRLSELPWLKDHVIDSKVIFPAAGFVCIAIEAAVRLESERVSIKTIKLRNISIKAALALREGSEQGHEVLVELYPATTSSRTTSDSWLEFAISSYDEANEGIEHCRGRISVVYGSPRAITPSKAYPAPEELFAASDGYMTPMALYERLESLKSHYGPRFALLKNDIATGPGFGVTKMSFDPGFQTPHELGQKTILHPTFLDASFHVMFPVIENLLNRQMSDAFVSTFMGSLDISGILAKIAGNPDVQEYTISTFTEVPSPRLAINDIIIYQPDGQVVIEARGIEATAVETQSGKSKDRTLFFRHRWQKTFDFWSDRSGLNGDEGDLGTLLDSFSYQFPTARILYITAQPHEVDKMIRSSLWFEGTQRPRFQQLKIWTPTGAEDLSPSFDCYGKNLVTFGEPEGVYDLIVVDCEPTQLGNPLSSFLSDSGAILTQQTLVLDNLQEIIPPQPWGVLRRVKPAPVAPDVTVLMPSYQVAERTSSILEHLHSLTSINSVTVHELRALRKHGLRTSVVIVLATLEESIDSSDETWTAIRELTTTESITTLWLVEGATMECSNPDHALLLGLLRTARNENPASTFLSLDVQKGSPAELIATRINKVLSSGTTEEEFAERNGQLYIPRVEEAVQLNRKLPHGIGNEPKPARFGDYPALTLRIGQVGLLESLHFVENQDILGVPLGNDEVEIKVAASSINFHDIAVATGIIQDYKMGDECAGRITQVGKDVDPTEFQVGDRVVAFNPGMGAHGTVARSPAVFCAKVPDSISLTDVASLPVVLSTALYCLVDVARLQPGETVLIHTGAGGVGQVAIQIAQRIGARVLVTCSKPKRRFLQEQYGLAEDQIFNSRDDSFVAGVLAATQGQGVDVVLNSLAGGLLLGTWSCVGKFGRFIEIGKRDIHQNSNLGMEPFRRNATFAAVDMVLVFQERPGVGREVLTRGLEMFYTGEIRPPAALHTFSFSEIEKAFRMLQLGRKPGKVVVVPDENDTVLVKPTPYQRKTLFAPSKTYLLVGGLGGLGTALAEWMHSRGARRFAFLSRSGAKTADAQKTVAWLKARDSTVDVYQGDVGVPGDVRRVVDSIGDSLSGLFHMPVDLHDAMIRTTTLTQIRDTLHTKCLGAKNLHDATLALRLDYFVSFSSVSAICGNRGQGAYGAANAWLDAFMRWRREQGLVGTAMNAGTVSTRGLVVNSLTARQSLERGKWDTLTEKELMYLAEEAVLLEPPQSDPKGLDWHQLIVGINVADPEVFWGRRALFRNLYANRAYDKASAMGSGSRNVTALIRGAANEEAVNKIVLDAFLDKIAAVLGIEASSIAASNPLSFYGLDSIIAIEFRRWFTEALGVDLPLFDILSAKSIEALVLKAIGLRDTLDQGDRKKANDDSLVSTASKSKVPVTTLDHIPWEGKAEAPLSTAQCSLAGHTRSGANLSAVLDLHGTPSLEALEGALRILVHRHGALRTALRPAGDTLVQQSVADSRFPFSFHDLSDSSAQDVDVERLISRQRDLVLHGEKGEVGAVFLLQLAEDRFKLVIVAHPLSFDGRSLAVFLEDWGKLYDAIQTDQDTTTIPQPRITYGDFARWEQARETQVPPPVSLTNGHVENTATQRGRICLSLENRLLTRMKRVAGTYEALPVHFLLAALSSFFYRETGGQDLVALLVEEGRPHPDVEEVIGCFLSLVPLQLRVGSNDAAFENLLDHVRHTAEAAATDRSRINLDSDPADSKIQQIAIQYEVQSQEVYQTVDFNISIENPMIVPLRVPIVVKAVESEELTLWVDYSVGSVPGREPEQFFQSFLVYLSSLIRDPRQPIIHKSLCEGVLAVLE